jgi:predicted alpha/beta superfamily hydrolase
MTEWNDYPLAGTGAPGQVTLRVCPEVLSPQLRNHRDILVALPPGYAEAGGEHPVIYMQDGQNLFDPTTSFAGGWGLVPTMNTLPQDSEAPIVGYKYARL